MTLVEQFKQEGYEKAKVTLSEQFNNEGRIEGEQKGKLEAYKNIAVKLIGQGMYATQVASVTGLSIMDVEQLKSNLSH